MQNLFHDLMTNYSRCNYVFSKASKLWKLITCTGVKIQNQKYWHKACNSDFEELPLHAVSSDQRWRCSDQSFQSKVDDGQRLFMVKIENILPVASCAGIPSILYYCNFFIGEGLTFIHAELSLRFQWFTTALSLIHYSYLSLEYACTMSKQTY